MRTLGLALVLAGCQSIIIDTVDTCALESERIASITIYSRLNCSNKTARLSREMAKSEEFWHLVTARARKRAEASGAPYEVTSADVDAVYRHLVESGDEIFADMVEAGLWIPAPIPVGDTEPTTIVVPE